MDENNYIATLVRNWTSKEEFTFVMDEDIDLKINVVERNGVKKIPITSVTSNYTHSTSGSWSINNLIDGYRISTDGSVNGMATKGYASATPTTPITITLDLGSVQLINQLSLFPRTGAQSLTGGARCFPKDFTIAISEDGKTFYPVKKVEDQPDPHIQQQVYGFDKIHARYVRVTITRLGEPDYHVGGTSAYRVQLAEAEVAYVTPAPVKNPLTPNNPTDSDEVTTDATETQPTDGEANGKKGCFSTVSGGLSAILFAIGAAFMSRKKKRD